MRPLLDSRGVRVRVERGNMPYSAVIHPFPVLRKKLGTVSSIEAVQITRVCPTSIKVEPSAVEMNSGVIRTVRIWSALRLSIRKACGAVASTNDSILLGLGCDH